MNSLSIKKEKIIALACAACILLQAESMFPSSIVLMAIFSFLLAPSLFLNGFKKYYFLENCKWMAILLSIMVTTAVTGLNSVSISYLVNYGSMFFLVTYISARLSVKNISEIFYIISMVSLIGIFWQFFMVNRGDINSLSEMRFVFSDRNDLGLYLVAGFFANLYVIRLNGETGVTLRKINLITIFIILILLGSRSSLLAFSLAVTTFMFTMRSLHKLFALCIIIFTFMVAMYFLLPSNIISNLRLFNPESSIGDSDIIRFSLIIAAIELFIQSPFFGVGPNMFLVKSGAYLNDLAPNLMSGLNLSDGLVTHNSYAQYFVELGIFVGLFIIYRLIKIFRLFFHVYSIKMSENKRLGIAFLFSITSAFAVSGFFLNLHSTIFFIFVIFGMDVLVLRIMRSNE